MTARKPAHAAPQKAPYPARHRKPNRRPEVTTYYPSEGQVQALAYIAAYKHPFATL